MANAPIVSWYEGTNSTENEVKGTVNYGTVDADSASPVKKFFIWNNRAGVEECSKMEEVVFTTRDRNGGTGDTPGNIVEAVMNNWFQVRVDSLGEESFTPVGKGGEGTANVSGTKAIGTTGTTINVDVAGALDWAAETELAVGAFVKPIEENGFIYEVIQAGTTNNEPPTFVQVEGETFFDGTVQYIAVVTSRTAGTHEILGMRNNTLADGSNAEDAAGNFAEISVYAEVPITASAGKNLLIQRVSYRYV